MRSFLSLFLVCSFSTSPLFSSTEEEGERGLFLSTPEQIATLTSDHNYLIGGVISPLSGQPVLRKTDLIVKGAQPIILNRVYIPPYIPCAFPQHKNDKAEFHKKHLYFHLLKTYKGWQFYPHLQLELDASCGQVRVSDSNGMTLDFQLHGPRCLESSLISASFAMNNISNDLPSGKYDPRNTKISYDKNAQLVTVYLSDGTIRLYRRGNTQRQSKLVFLLEKEILPNGKVLKFDYNRADELSAIHSLDPHERYVYAFLEVEGSPRTAHCHFTSSSGQTVDYGYQKRLIEWKLKEKIKKKVYLNERMRRECPPILTSVSSPFYRHESLDYCDRFLLQSYQGKEEVFALSSGGFGWDDSHYKIDQLLLPVGEKDALVPLYQLSYYPPSPGKSAGQTTVRNQDGTTTVYHFASNFLTDRIQYFDLQGKLEKERIYSWDPNQWLKSLEERDGQNQLFYKKTYEYDIFGNPILEEFAGDLTGEGKEEIFWIKRIFSEDGKHLLFREEQEDGKITRFIYLPSTNLLTAKFIQNGEQILLREFNRYDDCNNLIQTIFDDGDTEDLDNLSHVTERIQTTYLLRQNPPFLHMPEWVIDTYWDDSKEKLLKKRHFLYDQQGNISEEEVYDADGTKAYTLYKTYNERGDLLTETNPLGQQAVYTYDTKGRIESATNFSHRLHKTYQYDTKGRLRAFTEKGDDGIVHHTTTEYDFYDQPTCKKDPYFNSTHFSYDPVIKEVIKTDFPSILSINGKVTPVSSKSTYDSFGRKVTKTDPNGHVITYSYNAYSSPTEILYPDGRRETFRYAKNGRLRSHTDLNGLTLHYQYDILGRVLSKSYFFNNQHIAEESYTYSGYHLLTETDKKGNLKRYTYNGAGRKIREDFCGHVTDFSYTPLGWLRTLCKRNEENTLFIHYKRDLNGKVLEESKTDLSGTVLYRIQYSYDADGNIQTTTRYINGNESIQTYTYDSFQRLIEEKDPLGHVTKTVYNENTINTLGQRVLEIQTTDPHAITTLTTNDALSRTIKQEVQNSQGMTLSCHEKFHDPQGNLVYRVDHLYNKGHFLNTQTIHYTYTTDNQRASLTRAFGTEQARTTRWTYFSPGRTATKTLPNGVSLAYSYHPLGFISRIDSSDSSIHHAFEYDLNGYLRFATDENSQLVIQREIDPFGNVLQEKFSNGLNVAKEYDNLNRLISLSLGNQGKVLYTYDPLYLRAVTRISSSGEQLYKHQYETYDEDGNLISEKLIGTLGPITHHLDPRSQTTLISSPYFSEEYIYDARGNLIQKSNTDYSYDDLSQLISENTSTYLYDSLFNRLETNGILHQINPLNELTSAGGYDLNGNQISNETFHFTYDSLNRLIHAASDTSKIDFLYDPLGRRLSKVVQTRGFFGWKETLCEHYLYDGEDEIGAFTSSLQPINLRVLGLFTVGIELEDHVLAPILDVQGNIRRLIDPASQALIAEYEYAAFGNSLPICSSNPWRFASKRLDPELGLIYFGKRYYDPQFGRWLTPDPVGMLDSVNLYQYVFNNPFRYRDPDGQFVIAFPLMALTWKLLAVAVVSAYAQYELEHHHRHSSSPLDRAFNAAAKEIGHYLLGASSNAVKHYLSLEKKKARTEPKNLEEQLTLEEAKKNEGNQIMQDKIKDPKYPKEEWKKMQYNHKSLDGVNTEVHYWENIKTREKEDLKFKDYN